MTADPRSRMTRAQAVRFAALPLAGLAREYSNHVSHLMCSDADVRPPRELHPIFYGCYDWHSAVHGYWLLARCLRLYPDLDHADAIVDHFAHHLTPERGAVEAAYFEPPERRSFERPYGWGWLLALIAELARLERPEADAWRRALQPLAGAVHTLYRSHLEGADYPIRAGVHDNTAFAMILARHYAEVAGDDELAMTLDTTARRLFADDRDYPAAYEPSGADFLSGGLVEALLLARVLPGAAFETWFNGFLPAYARGEPGPFRPAAVADRSDAKTVHLDGLNLSRAWCLRGIAAALPEASPAHPALLAAADDHEAAGLPHVDGGDYVGEHWLATFAALAVDGLEG